MDLYILYILAVIFIFALTIYINIFSCKKKYKEGIQPIISDSKLVDNNSFVPFKAAPLIENSLTKKKGKLMTLNFKEKPITKKEKLTLVDPDQGEGKIVKRKKNYKIMNYDSLNPIKNYVKVEKNLPLFEIAKYASNDKTTEKAAAYVCKNNNWKTKYNKKDKRSGWSKYPVGTKKCVGIYNTNKKPNEWNILISCKDRECDKFNFNPINNKIKKVPNIGETIWSGYPENIGDVYKLNMDGLNKSDNMRNSLEYRFKEVNNMKNIEIDTTENKN